MARIRWKGNKKNFQHCQNSASIGCCQVNNKRDKLVFLKKKKKGEEGVEQGGVCEAMWKR